jgi:acetyl esterase/lipase
MSFYSDSYDGQWMAETSLIKELIPHIDATYRTMASRHGRAIQGMSMGGFGALKLALKYPELFSSVVAFAGGYRSAEGIQADEVSREILRRVFGGDVQRFRANHPASIARTNAQAVRDRVAIKMLVGLDDYLLENNRSMHATLTEFNLPHEYWEIPGIKHDLPRLSAWLGAEGLEFAARHFTGTSPERRPAVTEDTGAVAFEKETVVYREVGPLAIKADVYHYPDTKTRPVVVSLHGGALIMGHRENLTTGVRAFALTNGYVLVSFDYRLAPETHLPTIIEDIEDAFRWLRSEGPKRFHIDPERVAVTGGSAGGYLTLVTGYRVQPPPRVLLAFYGYGDLIGEWYSSPSPHPRHNARKISPEEAWRQVSGPLVADARDRNGDGGIFYNFCRQSGQWPKAISGWDPGREAQKFFPYMPLKNVTKAYPPTALIHGTADTDVPFQQSQLMTQELQGHGVPFQFHPIAQAEHGLAGGDPAEIKEADRKAFEFVKLYLERP